MKRAIGILWRVAALALLAGAGWWAWQVWGGAREKPASERYQFEEVSTGDLTQTVTANGTLNPLALVNVGTQVSGTVRKLHADFNDRVKAGQVLLELDPTLFRANVQQSSGELATAEAALKLAQAEEQRMNSLFEQEYVSRADLDKAIQAREAAQALMRTARGKLERDQANLSYSVIRSPVAGVVVSREVDIGQTVAASFQTPTLFRIAQDLTTMRIDSNVAEADIGKIKVGQTVRFTVDAFPERRFEGKVNQIRLNPLTVQNVVTYNVVVAVSNPDLALMPGMTAYLSIVVDQRSNALLVPNAALRFRPRDAEGGARRTPKRPGEAGTGERTLHVLRGDKVVPVPIKTGISDTRSTEVIAGELRAGEQVVVEELTAGKAAGASQQPQPFRLRTF
jgi:HlyD family secretion protein